eukprot:282670-Hanusia_phi.AAC.3
MSDENSDRKGKPPLVHVPVFNHSLQVVKFEVSLRSGHPPASSELDQQILIGSVNLQWDGGSAIEFRKVILIDQPQVHKLYPLLSSSFSSMLSLPCCSLRSLARFRQLQHVPTISSDIKGAMEVEHEELVPPLDVARRPLKSCRAA